MKYLMDTHTLLWSLFSPDEISKKVQKILVDPKNEVFVSIITFWEISLKYNLGKLNLYNITPEEIPDTTRKAGFNILQLDEKDASSFYRLPKNIHKDPFDRLIIWQCIKNDFTILSKDKGFKEYSVHGLKLFW